MKANLKRVQDFSRSHKNTAKSSKYNTFLSNATRYFRIYLLKSVEIKGALRKNLKFRRSSSEVFYKSHIFTFPKSIKKTAKVESFSLHSCNFTKNEPNLSCFNAYSAVVLLGCSLLLFYCFAL